MHALSQRLLGNVRSPGLAFFCCGRIMSFLVLLYLLAERLVLFPAFLGVMLLLLKNGGSSCRGLSGFMSFMLLVNRGATDHGKRRKDCKKDLGIDELQHRVSELWKVGLPGATLIRGTRVIHGALLLNKGGGIQVHRCGVPTLHIGDRHLRSEAGLQDTLRLHLAPLLGFCRVQEFDWSNLI